MAKWKGWEKVRLDPQSGRIMSDDKTGGLDAIAPLIISASRSTDIPAFYPDWLMERLRLGCATWVNPFNGTLQHVSFERARVLVFWSKNPQPFLPYLGDLTVEGRQMLFHFTLNDYTTEGLEPGVPALDKRILTFTKVSSIIGKSRLTWRFDPILLSDTLTPDGVLDRIGEIGDRVYRHTSRLVFSFIDIRKYLRVQRNLDSHTTRGVREPTTDEEMAIARGISELNEEWGLEIQACGEEQDFNRYGIGTGACISREILAREFPEDCTLMDFLFPDPDKKRLKDPGQRRTCGCVPSKDIGHYGTCMHLCTYCYANSSKDQVRKNFETHMKIRREGLSQPSIVS
jgi:DNA repair photolyase